MVLSPPASRHGRHAALLLLLLPPSSRGCFHATIKRHLDSSCVVRVNYSRPSCVSSAPQMPVYVLHALYLDERRAFMRSQLRSLCAEDVSWMLCLDRPVVASLDAAAFRCLHPCFAHNRYNPAHEPHISNGTLSLALKHKAAYVDMELRNLPAALVLEDDAVLPPTLWPILAAAAPPADATILFVGSYSLWPGGSLRAQAQRQGAPATAYRQSLASRPPVVHVLRRNASDWPPILGAVAYVVLRRGARIYAHTPVLSQADVGISYLDAAPQPQPEATTTTGT
ncbi:hypothetical protein AB1Y20_007944 [Prymnesium parvum]|uniref:Uncharacterized protein n=1 Tax=Prymnesium parvum TaxID=97485 RepID=A0AB34IT96_PRYPA